MANETVLVTGGAGYIGAQSCKALAHAGYHPVVLDDLSRGHREFVRWGPLQVGSIGDFDTIVAVLERYQPTIVIHFAAYAYVGESVTDPALYYRNNVIGTLIFLDALLRHGVDKVVFSSSCTTYGVPKSVPITESEPQIPSNPYGQTKLLIERALGDYRAAYGLRSVALRYFNAAGADPEGELGERHDPETHLIPLAIRAALKPQTYCLEVFGTDYPTPDGTCIRDYIHVADLAAAHVLAVQYLAQGGGSTALNCGYGKGHSVREVIEAVARVTGKPVQYKDAPRRSGDPPELWADCSRIRETLGFQPHFDRLDTIVEHAVRWQTENLI